MDSDLDEIGIIQLYDSAENEYVSKHYKRAMSLYKQVLDLGEQVMPLDIRIDAREALAVCCYHLKRYHDAASNNRIALELLDSSWDHGPSHEVTIRVRYNLARALAATPKSNDKFVSKLKEAVSLYEQNLSTVTAEGDVEILQQTRQSLASALVKLSKYSEANKLYEQLLPSMISRPHKPEDLEYLRLKHEYAGVLYHLKLYQNSKKLFLQIQDAISSLSDPQRINLANLSESVDRYLAACVEVTTDLNLGVARSVAATTKPVHTLSNTTRQNADQVPQRQNPLPQVVTDPKIGKKTTFSRSPSIETRATASSRSEIDELPGKSSNKDTHLAPDTEDSSSRKSKLASSTEIPKTGSNLTVPSIPKLKGRRSRSDQYLDRSKQTSKPVDPIARPKSAQSSLASTGSTKPRAKSDPDVNPSGRPAEHCGTSSLDSGAAGKAIAKPAKDTSSHAGKRATRAATSSPNTKVKSRPDISDTSGTHLVKFQIDTSNSPGAAKKEILKTPNSTGNDNSFRHSSTAAPTLPPPTSKSKPNDELKSSTRLAVSRNTISYASSTIGKEEVKNVKPSGDAAKSSTKAAATPTKIVVKGQTQEIQKNSNKNKGQVSSSSNPMPGTWPDDTSTTATSALKLILPPSSKSDISGTQSDSSRTEASNGNVTKPVMPSTLQANQDAGRLFDLPPEANDTDQWFYLLRRHTHTLLGSGIPKNPNRTPVRVAILDSGLAGARNGIELPMSREGLKKIRLGHVTYKDFTDEGTTSFVDSTGVLHGTWCASLVMQTAPNAELYIANVVKPNITGQEPRHVAAAIAWAIEQRVDIISMSFGWESEKAEVDVQLERARQNKILIFAAASNYGDLIPDHGIYPASKNSVYCIYSCRGSGVKSAFNPRSSVGQHNFMFPGEDLTILDARHKPVKGAQQDQGKTTERRNGTSYATPIAAGTAAMVLDLARQELKYPEDLQEVERRLKTVEGMSDVFLAMSGGARDGGYYHVRPWKKLGEKKPIDLVSQKVNETHKWFTLMEILEVLHPRFGPYSKTSS